LGSAATSLEPLDATQLHLLHLGLSQLRELLPQNSEYETEAKIYNEKMRCYAEGTRDFMFARYYLNRRYDDDFWNQLRDQPLPDQLQQRLSLFGARGLIPMFEDDLFLEEDWYALFVGSRLRAEHLDPLIARIPDEELMPKFQQLLAYIKTEVEKMPLLQSYTEMTL
jgi:tryptophan halogenase